MESRSTPEDPAPARKGGKKPAGNAGAPAPETVQELFQSGLDWSHKGNNQKAVEEYRRALAVDPNLVAAHFALGTTLVPQSYVVVGSGVRDYEILDEAIEHLARACELEESAEHAYWLGRALDLRDRKDEALAKLTRAVELDPAHGLAHKRLGLIQKEGGETDKALESFRKALDMLPDDPGIHFQIGNLLEEKDPSAAKTSYEKAIEIDPTYPWAYHGLATVLSRLGDEEGHARVLQEGVRWKTIDEKLQARIKRASNNPSDVEAQIAAGDMLFALERWEDALQMFRRALALDQGDPYIHMHCGIILRELGLNEIAMNHLEEACYLAQQQGLEPVQPLIELARVYRALENEARVKELLAKVDGLLEKTEELDEHLIAAKGFLALAYNAEAAREFEIVLAGDPESEEAKQGLAQARGEEAK